MTAICQHLGLKNLLGTICQHLRHKMPSDKRFRDQFWLVRTKIYEFQALRAYSRQQLQRLPAVFSKLYQAAGGR